MNIKKLQEKDQPKFNPKQVILARASRGITQRELATAIGMTPGNLSKLENGIQSASGEIIKSLCSVLDYPVSFFHQAVDVTDLSGFHYRRRLHIPKREIEQAEANINIFRMNIEKLTRSIEIPKADYLQFDLSKEGSPAECAKQLRAYWKTGKGRIDNLPRLIEDNGILIVDMDFETKIDGLSFINGEGTPIVFISSAIPSDRYRLTLAHELGHLVMHVGKELAEERNAEKEAFLFAAEFLMPEEDIKPSLENLSLDKLAELKPYWKTSMGALLKRAHVLELLTDNQHHYLWKQMGSQGYRSREPEELDFPKEYPSLIRELIDLHLRELMYSEKDLAELLCLNHAEFVAKYLPPRARLKLRKG